MNSGISANGVRSLLRRVFPAACPVCGGVAEETPLYPVCRQCQGDLPLLPPEHCRICAEPGRYSGGACEVCAADPPPFEAVLTRHLYSGSVMGAVRAFKYAGHPELARALARMIAPAVMESGGRWDGVVPMPLHWLALFRRGYNQSHLVARVLAAECGLSFWPGRLERIRRTQAQAGLDREARARNVLSAFRAAMNLPAGSRILLVDDVVTTGATARAAARALLEGGAGSVSVAAIARAPTLF
ncbi:MAG: hypothetical protein GMKNLPBB_00333 [Myxococcota bacterium]|nr:hypothetical protein [Myxococcota bacterium]